MPVRDDTPGQTPGDGVTFRVRVLPLDAPEGKQGEIVFERHVAAKTWQDGEADLTRFAGQRIRLQLESHPGPKNNTTNDQSYWAEPTVISGQPTPVRQRSTRHNIGPASESASALADCSTARLPSAIFPSTASRCACWVTRWKTGRSPSVLTGVREESDGGRYRVRHSFRNWAGTFDLVGELWVEERLARPLESRARTRCRNPGSPCIWKASAPARGADRRNASMPATATSCRTPAAFTLSFDGHRLSTSYAGFDFADGSFACSKPSMSRPPRSTSIPSRAPTPCAPNTSRP